MTSFKQATTIMPSDLNNTAATTRRAILPWIVLVIFAAALSRLLPHPWNFTPIGAMALFGGAYLGDRKLALIVTLAALWLSDLLLNNLIYSAYFDGFAFSYPDAFWTYGAFALVVLLGHWLLSKRRSALRIAGCSVTASTLFFVVSNFGVWASGQLYPQTWQGLVACYTAALPFYGNNLIGDLFYCTLLFGGFALAGRHWSRLAAV